MLRIQDKVSRKRFRHFNAFHLAAASRLIVCILFSSPLCHFNFNANCDGKLFLGRIPLFQQISKPS